MRSGTCRMLKLITNVSVPFLIYAVMLSLRFINEELKSKQGVFNLFLCGGFKILILKISTLQIKLQISEKYL